MRYLFISLLFLQIPLFAISQDDETYLAPLPRDTFYSRQVPDTILNRLRLDRTFAYANDEDYWKREEEQPSAFTEFLFYLATHSWVKWMFLSLFTTALVFVLINIIKSNRLNLFYSSRKGKLAAPAIEDQPKDYQQLVGEAISMGDFRLAIRYHFLQTLNLLYRKNVIEKHPDATNQQYLASMRNHKSFATFQQLTRIYEYVWYGEFSIDQKLFQSMSERFYDFNQQFN